MGHGVENEIEIEITDVMKLKATSYVGSKQNVKYSIVEDSLLVIHHRLPFFVISCFVTLLHNKIVITYYLLQFTGIGD